MAPTFPEFSPLSLDQKEGYERLVAEYPPFSDLSFATLHIWWNLEGKLSISTLNSNLIINYHLPFDEPNSGYCIIGKHQLEESMQILFEFLHSNKQPVKLVHVPDFVVAKIEQRDWLKIEEEIDYNEYILDSKGLASLEDAIHGRTRRKIRRFMREVEDRNVEIKELDLSLQEVKDELLESVTAWSEAHPSRNDPENTEQRTIHRTLEYATHFDIKHMGLYIDSKLYAIVLYHQSHDKQYYILHHIKVDYSIPYIFDYMTHNIATKAAKDGVDFLNMEMDLGIESLRNHKMGLRPVNFFRKYTISPASVHSPPPDDQISS